MILGFSCSQTEKIFNGSYSKVFPPSVQRAARRKLIYLDEAEIIEDLRVPPGNRLEKLKGNRIGQYSIRINNQWRLCFVWRGKDAFDVEIVDYH